jgi:predicted secreted protein
MVLRKDAAKSGGLTQMNAGSYVLLPLPAGPITSWAWRIEKAGQLTYDDSGQMKNTTEALIARL